MRNADVKAPDLWRNEIFLFLSFGKKTKRAFEFHHPTQSLENGPYVCEKNQNKQKHNFQPR